MGRLFGVSGRLLELLEDNSQENGTYKVRFNYHPRDYYGSDMMKIEYKEIRRGIVLDIPSVVTKDRAKYLAVLGSDYGKTSVEDEVSRYMRFANISKETVAEHILKDCRTVAQNIDEMFRDANRHSFEAVKKAASELTEAEEEKAVLVAQKEKEDGRLFGIPKFFRNIKDTYFRQNTEEQKPPSLEKRIWWMQEEIIDRRNHYEFLSENQFVNTYTKFDRQFMEIDKARLIYQQAEERNHFKEEGLVTAVSLDYSGDMEQKLSDACAEAYDISRRCFSPDGKLGTDASDDLKCFLKTFGTENQLDENSLQMYVPNGLVLPDNIKYISFSIYTSQDYDTHESVVLTPERDIPGLFKMEKNSVTDGIDLDHGGTTETRSSYVFLDGKKMAKAMGCEYTIAKIATDKASDKDISLHKKTKHKSLLRRPKAVENTQVAEFVM